MTQRILIPLASGFEEMEAVISIDVLRRAGFDVKVCCIEKNEELSVEGSHDIRMHGDIDLSEAVTDTWDAIVLPGGMPGSTHLKSSKALLACLKQHDQSQTCLAAICAAPQVLAAAGCLEGRKICCYPGFEKDMGSAQVIDQQVVRDGHIITGKGVGASFDFALAIVSYLATPELAAGLRAKMVLA